jgi:hypothetical protein
MAGVAEVGLLTRMYQNNGSGFSEINIGLTGIKGSVTWGDYDNDGDLDLLLIGYDDNAQSHSLSKMYRNDGGNQFVDIGELVPPIGGAIAWGDYDNDNDLDILQGNEIYQNNGGSFSPIHPAVIGGFSAWGDYDNGGDLDILKTLEDAAGFYSKIYQNNGGSFAEIPAGLIGVSGASAWGDYDNDGDLDVLLTGTCPSQNSSIAKIYRNNTTTPNTAPPAPAGLAASVAGNAVTLNWNKATDNQTPQNGLTYNLRIGTTPGGSEIVTPMADANNDSWNDGYHRIPALGNTNH